MRRVLIAAALAMAASYAAYAQDPAPKPDANAVQPPEQATPTMKAPEGQPQTAPTDPQAAPAAPQAAPPDRTGEAVPPTKSTDEQSAGAGTQAPGSASFTVTAGEEKDWIGRPVYSSEGNKLGEIAKLNRASDDKVSELYVDIGGFLGFGATRALISSDQIQEVKADGLVLKLSETEAESLPAAEEK